MFILGFLFVNLKQEKRGNLYPTHIINDITYHNKNSFFNQNKTFLNILTPHPTDTKNKNIDIKNVEKPALKLQKNPYIQIGKCATSIAKPDSLDKRIKSNPSMESEKSTFQQNFDCTIIKTSIPLSF